LLRTRIETADGLNRAADLIEGAFGTGGGDVPFEVVGSGNTIQNR
jgi:hypothetical protein